MDNTENHLRTKAEIARFLRISEPTLDRLRARGEILGCLVGVQVRFRDSDIQEYLSRRVEARRTRPRAADIEGPPSSGRIRRLKTF